MPSCSHGKIAVLKPQDTSHDSRGRISVYVWYKDPKAVYRVKRPGVIGRARAAYTMANPAGHSLISVSLALLHTPSSLKPYYKPASCITPTHTYIPYNLHATPTPSGHSSPLDPCISHTFFDGNFFSLDIPYRYVRISM